MRTVAATLTGICLFALTAGQAHATVMMQLETAQMAEKASDVVKAKVLGQRVILVDGQPWTETALRVVKAYKGKTIEGAKLLVRQPGGETGTIGMYVPGVARFNARENVVAFLRPVGSFFVPVGWSQGKFEVYQDGEGVERVRRDLSGTALASFDKRGKMVIVPEVTLHNHTDKTLGQLLTAAALRVRR